MRLDFSNGDHFVARTVHPGGASGNPRRIRLFYRNAAKTTQLQIEFDISSYTAGDWHQFVITSKVKKLMVK